MNKILQVLVKKLGKYRLRRGVECSFKCPDCRDYKYRFDVNLKMKVFHCFHCGYSGQIWELLDKKALFNGESLNRKDSPQEYKEI